MAKDKGTTGFGKMDDTAQDAQNRKGGDINSGGASRADEAKSFEGAGMADDDGEDAKKY